MARKKTFVFRFEIPEEDGLFPFVIKIREESFKRAILFAQSWLRMHCRNYGYLTGTSCRFLVTENSFDLV